MASTEKRSILPNSRVKQALNTSPYYEDITCHFNTDDFRHRILRAKGKKFR